MAELSKHQMEIILNGGRKSDTIAIKYVNQEGHDRFFQTNYEGVIPNLQWRYRETTSDYIRSELERYMTSRPCPTCGGKRLRAEALAVTGRLRSIHVVSHYSITRRRCNGWSGWLGRSRLRVRGQEPGTGARDRSQGSGVRDQEATRTTRARHPHHRLRGTGSRDLAAFPSARTPSARQILKELHARLRFMMDVGLDYLSLDRMAATLSGGEAQRIRLATQIGSQLMGVLYILDEPSIGLHQRDNCRLIRTLLDLRNLGNTVLVVEHDEETMRAADWIVDLGPGAGEHGGHVVCSAATDEFLDCNDSLMAAYLRGEKAIAIPAARGGRGMRVPDRAWCQRKQPEAGRCALPTRQNYLRHRCERQRQSSLVNEVLYKALNLRLYRAKERPGRHEGIDGIENLDKVIDIDQSPIGRTPRSNPATYTDL